MAMKENRIPRPDLIVIVSPANNKAQRTTIIKLILIIVKTILAGIFFKASNLVIVVMENRIPLANATAIKPCVISKPKIKPRKKERRETVKRNEIVVSDGSQPLEVATL